MKLRIAAIAAGAVALLAAFAPGAAASPRGTGAAAAPGLEGGQAIYAPTGVRCTLGFNVRKGGSYYFLTAGGCGQVGLTLYSDPGLTTELGTVEAVTNAGVGLARYVDPQVERPGSVYLYPGSQDIVSAGSPAVGQRICRSSPVTHVQCGSVTAIDVTVNLPDGTVTGLATSTICAEPGDAPGAPYFSGTTAIGLEVTAQGDCSSGGTSYFQPIAPILDVFGAEIY